MSDDKEHIETQGLSADQSVDLARALGLVFSNSFLYGLTHTVTLQAVTSAYSLLQTCLSVAPEITITAMEEVLTVNTREIDGKNPLLRMLLSRMRELEVNTFTLDATITMDNFAELVELMSSKPEELKAQGGLSASLAAHGIGGVKSKTVSYVAITEDEVVVEKDLVGDGKGGAGSQTILAFLKGDIDSDNKEVPAALTEAANDAQKLAEMIMDAVELRKGSLDLEGSETLAELVVGCLKRMYDGFVAAPSMKTQKGKKSLQKTLLLLEKELLDRLRSITGEEGVAEISDTVEEMNDDLKIDALAEEYMKRRSAIEANENRILRFIKAKGIEKSVASGLQGKLFEGGLTAEGWHELLLRSGVEAEHEGGIDLGGSGGGEKGIGQLALLLETMQDTIESISKGDDVELKGMDKVLENVQKEVKSLVNETEKKIMALIDNVRADAEDDETSEKPEKEKRLSRRKLMQLLAEIGQELCQPLAVINCSVDMILSRALGAITDPQKDMLDLAAESGKRLHSLINKLMEIAGVPETRVPDSNIVDSLYQ